MNGNGLMIAVQVIGAICIGFCAICLIASIIIGSICGIIFSLIAALIHIEFIKEAENFKN